MVIALDAKDLRILEQLDSNCRQSNAQIARKVGLSKDAVGYRIKQMERRKVILRYYPLFNISKIGYITYKFLFTFKNSTAKNEFEMIDYLKHHGNVGWVVSCDGFYSLMGLVWVKDSIEFDDFFKEFLKKFGALIHEREIMVIPENHACGKAYLFDKEIDDSPDNYYSGRPESIVDEKEWKIMRLLANNSRVSLQKIARQVGLTPEAVAYRIKVLKKKNVIQAFRAIINTRLLGYQYYNVMFRLRKFTNTQKMFSFFKIQPNIIYYVKYLGKYDLGIDLEVRTAEELRQILSEIKRLFSNDIESYHTVLIYEQHKLSYLPE